MRFRRPEGHLNYVLKWLTMPCTPHHFERIHFEPVFEEMCDLFNYKLAKRVRPSVRFFWCLPSIINEIDMRDGVYTVGAIWKLVDRLRGPFSPGTVAQLLFEYADLGIITPPTPKDEAWDYQPFSGDTRISDVRQRERLRHTREQRKAYNKVKYASEKRRKQAAQGFPRLGEWLTAKYPKHAPDAILSDLEAVQSSASKTFEEALWLITPKEVAKQYKKELREYRQNNLVLQGDYTPPVKRRQISKNELKVMTGDGMAHALATNMEPNKEVFVLDLDDPANIDSGFEFSTTFSHKAVRGERLRRLYEEELKTDPHLSLNQFYFKMKDAGKLFSNGPNNKIMSLQSMYAYFKKLKNRGVDLPKRQHKPKKSYYKKKTAYVRETISPLNKKVVAYTQLRRWSDPDLSLTAIWQETLPLFVYGGSFSAFSKLIKHHIKEE